MSFTRPSWYHHLFFDLGLDLFNLNTMIPAIPHSSAEMRYP